MAVFNLIDEPWIPCTMLDGTWQTMGIRSVLAQARDVEEIGGDAPPVTAALHRLLLAVLHRNFDIADSGAWGCLWEKGRFDIEKLSAYFKRWHRRFDLFDEKKPFFQVAGLDLTKGGSSARLLFHQDNNPTLFTHLTTSDPPELSPAAAARRLLGFMSFDVGGTKTAEHGQKSAKAAMLNRGAVVQARGDNLFQTLMLNLCRYAPQEGEPWDFDPSDDIPAWERDDDTQPEERMPDGYIDLLTWQSRRIRLEPSEALGGNTVIQRVVIMDGYRTPDHILHDRETMVAFRRSPRAKGKKDPWPAITFNEGQALWRDSSALLHSVSKGLTQPKMLQWLGDLAIEDIIPHSRIIPVDVLGLCSDKAKVLFWRHERLSIPIVYLKDQALAECVQNALELTETMAGCLTQTMWTMAKDLLPAISKKKEERERIQELVCYLGAERAYWSRLEVSFKQLLAKLPKDWDEYGDYGEHSLTEWKAILRCSVMTAFMESTREMDQFTRNLRALARAEGRLRRMIHRHLSTHQEVDEDDAAEQDQQVH